MQLTSSQQQPRPVPEAYVRLGFDFYGTGNAGDDLMLAGFLQLWNRPERLVCRVSATQRLVLQSRFPDVLWVTSDRELPSYNEWIGVGDTPIQILSGPYFLDYLEQEMNAPHHSGVTFKFIGIGGEAEAVTERARFKPLLEKCKVITTRDAQTAKLLRDEFALHNVRIVPGSDLAHVTLNGLSPSAPIKRDIEVAINYYSEQRRLPHLWSLFRFFRKYKGSAVFLSNEAREFSGSEPRLYRRMRWLFGKRVPYLGPHYGSATADWVSHYDRIRVVIGSRYHVLLAAAWRGCRVSGIGRSSKIKNLCSELNVPICGESFGVEDILQAVACAKHVPRKLLEQKARVAVEASSREI